MLCRNILCKVGNVSLCICGNMQSCKQTQESGHALSNNSRYMARNSCYSKSMKSWYWFDLFFEHLAKQSHHRVHDFVAFLELFLLKSHNSSSATLNFQCPNFHFKTCQDLFIFPKLWYWKGHCFGVTLDSTGILKELISNIFHMILSSSSL